MRWSFSWQMQRAARSSASSSNQAPLRSWARTLTWLGLEPVAAAVLGPDLDVARALDHAPLIGQAEAALHAVLFAGGLKDFGVDEFEQSAVVRIHEEDPPQDAHLRRGKAGAIGLVQGLGHVVEEHTEPLVEFGHRAGKLVESRLLLGHDGTKCHVVSFLNRRN